MALLTSKTFIICVIFLIFPSVHICIAHTGSFLVWETAVKWNPKRANSQRWVMYISCVLAALWKVHTKSNLGIWNSEFLSHILKNTLIWISLVLAGFSGKGFLFISTEQRSCSQHPEPFWHSKLRFSFWKWTHQVISVHTEGASFLAYIHLFSFLCFFSTIFFVCFSSQVPKWIYWWSLPKLRNGQLLQYVHYLSVCAAVEACSVGAAFLLLHLSSNIFFLICN